MDKQWLPIGRPQAGTLYAVVPFSGTYYMSHYHHQEAIRIQS